MAQDRGWITGAGQATHQSFAGSGPVFGFREAVADSLDLVTERMGAETGEVAA